MWIFEGGGEGGGRVYSLGGGRCENHGIFLSWMPSLFLLYRVLLRRCTFNSDHLRHTPHSIVTLSMASSSLFP